jgi:glyoxylase-like metal-dependent hydrolase (beta-lactamase superfamily II)
MGAAEPTVECRLLDTGYCLARESHLIRGGRNLLIQCHSLVALLRHPEHGWLLWDAGYAPRMLEATARMPYALYRRITPLCLDASMSVSRQLQRFGLSPRDIRTVILSHFHADHIAGLRDFPEASLIATQQAYERVAGTSGFGALRYGFIPQLMPDNFAYRANLLAEFTGPQLGTLGPTHDLFGDGSLVLVSLPGHARGQLGLLARTDRGLVLFTADSCWLRRSIREQRPPHPITNLIVDDPRAVRLTLARLHTFAETHPEVMIIPSHCPEAFREAVTL